MNKDNEIWLASFYFAFKKDGSLYKSQDTICYKISENELKNDTMIINRSLRGKSITFKNLLVCDEKGYPVITKIEFIRKVNGL